MDAQQAQSLPTIRCLLPEYTDENVYCFILQFLRSKGFTHTASAFCLELKSCRGFPTDRYQDITEVSAFLRPLTSHHELCSVMMSHNNNTNHLHPSARASAGGAPGAPGMPVDAPSCWSSSTSSNSSWPSASRWVSRVAWGVVASAGNQLHCCIQPLHMLA